MKKRLLLILSLVVAVLVFCSCNNTTMDKAMDKVNEKLSIASVKSIPFVYDEDYNEVTFGEMTKEIFFKPKWSDYEGALYSFDEDEDGDPDEELSYSNAIQFSGKFKYNGEKYEMTIVFAALEEDSSEIEMVSSTLDGIYLSSEQAGYIIDMLWEDHIFEGEDEEE